LDSRSHSDANAILLLDDEFDLVASFKQLIEKKGFHVFGFTEALLALEHFQINRDKYALVLSDLRMPGMNGYEFIKKIKEIKPEVKVFFITAFEIEDIEFRRVLPSVKIDEFIQKPCLAKNLIAAIVKHMDIGIEPKRDSNDFKLD
jgi:response regulator RpfG family c-di-GMP phosphodiesterase